MIMKINWTVGCMKLYFQLKTILFKNDAQEISPLFETFQQINVFPVSRRRFFELT